jgi:acyl carrier protein
VDRESRIRQAIKSVAKTDADPASDESLFDSGVLDSFGLPDLVSALETEFSISIPNSDLAPKHFVSIRQIDAYLTNRGA